MDYYHIWFDLKNSAKDLEFAQSAERYLGHLREEGLIEGHRLARRKLGFGPAELGDFHVEIRTRDMARLDRAFSIALEMFLGIESNILGPYIDGLYV